MWGNAPIWGYTPVYGGIIPPYGGIHPYTGLPQYIGAEATIWIVVENMFVKPPDGPAEEAELEAQQPRFRCLSKYYKHCPITPNVVGIASP
jgi:hypothetical protein